MSPSIWGWFLCAVVMAFAALEIPGVFFGAPWGALTDFLRATEARSLALHWLIAASLAFGVFHVVGDWP